MQTAPAQPKTYDINALAKRLRRNPRYLASVIKWGGMTPHLAEKVSALTGLTVSYLIHRRLPDGGTARNSKKRRGVRQQAAAKPGKKA